MKDKIQEIKEYAKQIMAAGHIGHPDDVLVVLCGMVNKLPDPLSADGLRGVEIEILIGLCEQFIPENIATDDRKHMAMYQLYQMLIEKKNKALSAPLQPVAATKDRVEEVIKESGGMWKSCSGCHETVDGQETGHYDYSNVYSCYVGSGCHECGGIGVVWDDCNYSSYGQPVSGKSKEAGVPEGLYTKEQMDYVETVKDADLRSHLLHQKRLADIMEADRDSFEKKCAEYASSLRGSEWVSVEDKPLFTTGSLGWVMNEGVPSEFIAAIEVHNNKINKNYWWIRHCVVQDGTGLHVVTDDDTEPAGWDLSDIEFYMPMPKPPHELNIQPPFVGIK